MLYYSNEPKIIKIVTNILGNKFSSTARVNFSVAYSQNRNMSNVVIEMSHPPFVHCLIFFYNRSLRLYDVVRYRERQCKRISISGGSEDDIHKLNKFILKNIKQSNQKSEIRIDEDLLNEVDCVSKDYQIQSLKDRLRIAQATIQSLRNRMKNIRKRINKN